jgi:hypothetical protein
MGPKTKLRRVKIIFIGLKPDPTAGCRFARKSKHGKPRIEPTPPPMPREKQAKDPSGWPLAEVLTLLRTKDNRGRPGRPAATVRRQTLEREPDMSHGWVSFFPAGNGQRTTARPNRFPGRQAQRTLAAGRVRPDPCQTVAGRLVDV